MSMHIHCNKLETVHSRYSNKRQNSNGCKPKFLQLWENWANSHDPIYGSPKKDNYPDICWGQSERNTNRNNEAWWDRSCL
jgi:hypothetical protein